MVLYKTNTAFAFVHFGNIIDVTNYQVVGNIVEVYNGATLLAEVAREIFSVYHIGLPNFNTIFVPDITGLTQGVAP